MNSGGMQNRTDFQTLHVTEHHVIPVTKLQVTHYKGYVTGFIFTSSEGTLTKLEFSLHGILFFSKMSFDYQNFSIYTS